MSESRMLAQAMFDAAVAAERRRRLSIGPGMGVRGRWAVVYGLWIRTEYQFVLRQCVRRFRSLRAARVFAEEGRDCGFSIRRWSRRLAKWDLSIAMWVRR